MPIVSRNQNEFMAGLDALTGAQPSGTQTNQTLLPRSAFALASGETTGARMPPRDETEFGLMRMGARPDVPLDVESGVPPSVQFAAEVNRRREDVLSELGKVYGKQNVDVSPEGEIVLRNIQDAKTGKVKDVLFKPKGFGVDDLISLSTQAPEIIAGALAARTGNARGAWNAVKALAAMAGASETVGGIKDATVRKLEGFDVEPLEIAKSRSEAALFDLGFGGLLGAAGKAATKVVSPFAAPGVEQVEMQQGRKYLRSRYAENLKPTPGQATGSGLFLRMEAQARGQPGSAFGFSQLEKSNDEAIKRIQARFLGLSKEPSAAELASLPTSESVGQKAVGALGSETRAVEESTEAARRGTLQTATREAQALAGADLANPVSTTALGQAHKSEVTGRFEQFHDAMGKRYEQFFSQPELVNKNISAKPLAQDAEALIAKLPSETVTTSQLSNVVNAQGKPIVHTIQGQEVIKEFVPSGVLSKLKKLASFDGQSFRLDELKQMRTEVDNAIAEGVAIPGVNVHYLKEMRKMLTNRMEQGLDEIGASNLKPIWEKLNKDYAAGISKFEPIPIRRLLVKDLEKGAVGNTAAAEAAMGNSPDALDTFNAYKGFFGATSPEFQGLKKAISEKVLGSSLDINREYISGKALLSNLNDIRPEVAKEVFGASERELRKIAQASGIAEGTFKLEDIRGLEQSGTMTYQKLLDFVSKDAAQKQLYQNQVLKAVAKGNIGIDSIKPTEFVSKALENPRVSVKEIREVKAMLANDPELLEQIRVRASMNILEKSSMKTMKGPLADVVSAKKLLGVMTPGEEERYVEILGKDTYDGLMAIAKFKAPGEEAFGTFQGAGRLAGASLIDRIFAKGEVSAAGRALNNLALSILYTLPPIRGYLANTVVSPESAARAVNTVIASTPFIDAMRKQIGDANAEVAAGYFHDLLNEAWNAVPSASRQGEAQTKQSRNQADFMRSLETLKPGTNSVRTP